MATDYTAVVVTYNRLELLKECLEQVEMQTIPPVKIIVVNNASADGTEEYLREYKEKNSCYRIITCPENVGGAGGFKIGIQESVKEKANCVLLIDDDAVLEKSYMEKILDARQHYPDHQAFAGTVMTDGKIDTYHRKNLVRPGMKQKNCSESCYMGKNAGQPFSCDIASFCGMVIDKELIGKAGLPCDEYFIWNDDTEYSIRISQYTRFLVIPDAKLEHKTTTNKREHPHRRYDWREYYGIRNRILYVKKHGNILDRVVNGADMFCNIVLRNWLFSVVHMDGYDWEYEKYLVRKAYKDARVRAGVPKDISEYGKTQVSRIWRGASLQK